MGVAGVQPLHGVVDDDAHTDGDKEEQHSLDQHAADAGALAGAGTQHAGQYDDTDDVINDRRADDGRAEEALQVTKFLQRCHCDGNAGGCHDGADEQRTVKLRAAHCRKAVERAIQQRAAHQRHKHAHAGDQRSDGAGAHQLFQVRAQAGGEHQQHDADFGEDGNGIASLYQVQQARPDEQTGDDLAHDLRGLALAGDQRKEFSAQNNDRQVTKNGIHEISSPFVRVKSCTHRNWEVVHPRCTHF